jgi:DNA-directed RNA polymerase subunit RPC12/RpoP
MTPRTSSLAQISARSANGKITAIRLRQEAIAKYELNPNYCKYCGEKIFVKETEKVSTARRRIFCNQSCAAVFNNTGRPSSKKREYPIKNCEQCAKPFQTTRSRKRFCSNKCSSTFSGLRQTKDELHRRGFGIPERCSFLRHKQLDLEEGMANDLRDKGWEIFSPTVVCDRIGVKEGKVFFIEFKPASNIKLRSGQKRISDLVPEMYKVVVK